MTPEDTATTTAPIATLPENIAEMSAADVAKLFKDPPEGTDLAAVLSYEAGRDEPRSTVLKAAVAAALLDEEGSAAITAAAAARRDQPTDGDARFEASRILENPAVIGGAYARFEVVGAFRSAEIADEQMLTAEEANRTIADWLEGPVQTDDDEKEA